VGGKSRSSRITRSGLRPLYLYPYAGLAPGVPHFANLPFASLQRAGVAALGGHFTNLPAALRHGAAMDGEATATSPKAEIARRNLVIFALPFDVLARASDLQVRSDSVRSPLRAVMISHGLLD